jgi:putative ABC transport system ATP-binding protein
VVTLEASRVGKVYESRGMRTPALHHVDLVVAEGEFVALVGPSGSGKTTLLNLLGALDRPTSGAVLVDGEDLAPLDAGRLADLRLAKLGFVFQSHNLVPVLSARENVELPMELRGVPRAERRRRAEAALAAVGLAALGEQRPPELSGGQQQRVAVARAVAGGPRVVLADEPTASLDSVAAAALLDLMERLNAEQGTTFVFSTHDPRVVARARRTVRLDDGRVVDDALRAVA